MKRRRLQGGPGEQSSSDSEEDDEFIPVAGARKLMFRHPQQAAVAPVAAQTPDPGEPGVGMVDTPEPIEDMTESVVSSAQWCVKWNIPWVSFFEMLRLYSDQTVVAMMVRLRTLVICGTEGDGEMFIRCSITTSSPEGAGGKGSSAGKMLALRVDKPRNFMSVAYDDAASSSSADVGGGIPGMVVGGRTHISLVATFTETSAVWSLSNGRVSALQPVFFESEVKSTVETSLLFDRMAERRVLWFSVDPTTIPHYMLNMRDKKPKKKSGGAGGGDDDVFRVALGGGGGGGGGGSADDDGGGGVGGGRTGAAAGYVCIKTAPGQEIVIRYVDGMGNESEVKLAGSVSHLDVATSDEYRLSTFVRMTRLWASCCGGGAVTHHGAADRRLSVYTYMGTHPMILSDARITSACNSRVGVVADAVLCSLHNDT